MTGTLEQVGRWNGKSIPTFYAGVTFRSRTEARWAVFMDQLGVRWHYEHEGFELPSGWYVPDFWVPSINSYLEIKPSNFIPGRLVGGKWEQADASLKCGQLAASTGRRVVMLLGSPGEQGPAVDGSPYSAVSGHETGISYLGAGPVGEPEWCMDQPFCWCRCPACGKFGLEFDGRGGRVCHGCPTTDKDYSQDHPLILGAYATAEAWRFQ